MSFLNKKNLDIVECAQRLIQCESISPHDGGSLDYISSLLTEIGFTLTRLKYNNVDNLYARFGVKRPVLCFLGHVDVVVPGLGWTVDPFRGEILDEKLYGRGSSDMKGAVASFLGALFDCNLEKLKEECSIALLITSDEEGDAIDGTKKVVGFLKNKKEYIDIALIGEPTSVDQLGDVVKIGRRGSLNCSLKVKGKSGHVAYPHLASNPVAPLVSFLQRLLYTPLDEGNEFFQGSNLEITGLHTDTNVCNVIPSHAQASFNIRFNTSYTGEVLQHMMEEILDEFKLTYSKNYEFVLESTLSGDAFLSVHKPFQDFLGQVILQETGIQPIFNTSGGTSDGRFMKDVCPCIDFGLIGKRAHKSDEYVPIKDLFKLKDIYKNVINNFSRVDFSSDI